MDITKNNGYTVLVVDDEQGVCETLELVLKGEGYGVHTETSGGGALTWLKEKKPDIVFLDIKMPEMSGMELLREFRKKDKNAIVIILTAYSAISDAREAMRLGAYDYLTKPFDIEIVKELVREGLAEKDE